MTRPFDVIDLVVVTIIYIGVLCIAGWPVAGLIIAATIVALICYKIYTSRKRHQGGLGSIGR